jgi:hypothetical protein
LDRRADNRLHGGFPAGVMPMSVVGI